MTVVEIVKKHLKENGFDGLYSPGRCACKLDDLMPCNLFSSCCEAGYLSECKGDDECPLDRGCGFHIGPDNKRAAQDSGQNSQTTSTTPAHGTEQKVNLDCSAPLDPNGPHGTDLDPYSMFKK